MMCVFEEGDIFQSMLMVKLTNCCSLSTLEALGTSLVVRTPAIDSAGW